MKLNKLTGILTSAIMVGAMAVPTLASTNDTTATKNTTAVVSTTTAIKVDDKTIKPLSQEEIQKLIDKGEIIFDIVEAKTGENNTIYSSQIAIAGIADNAIQTIPYSALKINKTIENGTNTFKITTK